MLDLGCTKTVSGETRMNDYLTILHLAEQSRYKATQHTDLVMVMR